MLYLDYLCPQHIYQDMQKYVKIVLMKLYWSKPGENLPTNIIFIIFWGKIRLMYIKEYIIPNPKFQSSGALLVILSISRNMNYSDTREVSFIVNYHIYPKYRHECFLIIKILVFLQ